jgi:hypothetical protein
MRIDRLPRATLPYIVATFPHEGQSQAPGADTMNHPNTLSVAQPHGGQQPRGARGPVILSAWRALQQLFAGLCEPVQATARNPAAYPATFINLP